MKAMILAAGLGTRMRPLTLETPKPLLAVGGKPLIVWHIEALKEAGITDLVINAAWLADKLINTLGDGSQFGVNIQWSREEEALETAGGIIKALPLLCDQQGDEPFVLVNGDVWTRYDMQQLAHHQLGDDLAHLVLVQNPPQHPNGDFVLSEKRIYTDFPQQSTDSHVESNAEKLTFSGLSVLSPQLFKGLPEGKTPLAPILRRAMNEGRVSGAKLDQAWVDVGTPERLNQLDQQIRSNLI
jgi:MurNAc alpha-1-phosphate uridylyltransferase